MALDKFQPYLFVSAGEQSNKYLTPVISPDGIASFQAQRAQDLSGLTVRIDPIQEGSGDPSPDNIRPISGRTGMTVTRAGKNLLDDSIKTAQSTATVVIGQTSTTEFDIFLPAGTYTASFASEKNPSINYRLSTESSGAHSVISYGNRTGTFTLTEPSYLRMWAYLSGGIVPSDITWFQLEAGSTATPYTPYVAHTTYPITWETEVGTVYGGTLDVVSGVLTVDRYLLTCGETITPTGGVYEYATNPNRWQIALADNYMPDTDKMGESICDTFSYYDGGISVMPENTFRFSGIQSGGYRLIQFKWADQPTTVADLKAFLAENPIHFVIPFATPQTYQLTGAEVRTLAGFNQIYSDAGPVIDIKF